jgi:tape measure domain-containing protein
MMMADNPKISIEVSATGVNAVTTALNSVKTAGVNAEKALANFFKVLNENQGKPTKAIKEQATVANATVEAVNKVATAQKKQSSQTKQIIKEEQSLQDALYKAEQRKYEEIGKQVALQKESIELGKKQLEQATKQIIKTPAKVTPYQTFKEFNESLNPKLIADPYAQYNRKSKGQLLREQQATKIDVEIEPKSIKKAGNDIEKLFKKAKDTKIQPVVEPKLKPNKIESEFKQFTNKLANLATIYITIDTGKRLINIADEYRLLQNNVKLVTRDQNEYEKSLQSITKTSEKAGLKINQSASIYSRFAIELSKMGKNNAETNKFFETTVKLGSIGSSSVSSMNAALTQLGQSLGGVVQADEFRSIREQAPLIANALLEYYGKIKNGAKGAAISQGELQKMFKDGAVKSIDLYNAIIAKAQLAEDVFNRLPVSVERSFNALQNTFAKTFTQLDNSIGISQGLSIAIQGLAKSIDFLGQNTDNIKKILAVTATTATILSVSFGVGIVKAIGTLIPMLATMWASLKTGILLIGASITALSPLQTALITVATVGLGFFVSNFVDGMQTTRESVYKATNGMISDLDILMAKFLGFAEFMKAFNNNVQNSIISNIVIPLQNLQITNKNKDYEGYFNSLTDLSNRVKNVPNSINKAWQDAGVSAQKTENVFLKNAGQNQAKANALFGMGLGTKQKPFTGAEKENKKEKSKLESLRAELARTNSDLAQANLLYQQSNISVEAYAKQKQDNEQVARYNQLMGDYIGKKNKAISTTAKLIVNKETEIKLINHLSEFYSQYKIEIEKTTGLLSDEIALSQALASGSLAVYRAKEKQLAIDKAIREEQEKSKAGGFGALDKKQIAKITEKAKADQALKEKGIANQGNKSIETEFENLKNTFSDLTFLQNALNAGGLNGYKIAEKELRIKKAIREEEQKRLEAGGIGLTQDEQKRIKQLEEQKILAEEVAKKVEGTTQRLKNQYEEMGNAIKTAFDNTIEHMVNGTSSFKEIFVGLMRQLAVNALRALVSSGLQAFFDKFNGQTSFLGGLSGLLGKIAPSVANGITPTGSFGSGLFGTIGSGLTAIKAGTGGLGASSAGGSLSGLASFASKIGGFFGGFKATGGDMQANKAYVVGERGAEIFKPATSGTMIPNHAIGGGSSVVSNVNITMNGDGGSSSDQLKQSAQAISDMVKMKVYEILNTEKRQGGMFNRTGSYA